MRMRAHICWCIVTVLLLFSGALYGQQVQLQIDDKGEVVRANQQHNAKNGHKITWQRQTGAAKSWYVTFAESPCAEGSEFGSGVKRTTCTISVACNATDITGCKACKYSSATRPSIPFTIL